MEQGEKSKCIWTGEKNPRVKPVKLKTVDRFTIPTEKTVYVLPEYEEELRAFNKRLVSRGRFFLVTMLALTALIVTTVFFGVLFSVSERTILLLVGIITAAMGGLIIVFPFTTPETIKWLGLQKAQFVARALGVTTIILGLLISLLPEL